MFITSRQAEVNDSKALIEPGYQGWHFVQPHLISPWFHVSITRYKDGMEFHDVLFVDSMQTLSSILELSEIGVQVKSVQLVSPGWLNGDGDWRMDMLREVARSRDGTSLRYTLQDGRHYYYPDAHPETSSTYCVQVFPKPQVDNK